MDPLTHTLVGANLAATRLGEKTRLAAAALVIGANLPDVDSILYFTGHDDLALWFRRGWTHGVLALVLLPFVQTALLLLFDRLRPDARRSVSVPWLFGLSAFAILTHPTLDWLNNYGMRWLMPFDGTWFYGDSVYIMDPWLWLVLGGAWLAGRRATLPMVLAFVIVTGILARIVMRRSADYVVVLAVVAVILFAMLLWRAPRSFSAPALLLATAYIVARLVIHHATALEVRKHLDAPVVRLMVGPHPIDPRRWDVVAQTGDVYRFGHFTWAGRTLTLAPERLPVAKDSPEYREAKADPHIRGWVNWMRFPWYEIERRNGRTIVHLHDARYATRRRPGGGFGGVSVVLR
jgi:inner membrane protein